MGSLFYLNRIVFISTLGYSKQLLRRLPFIPNFPFMTGVARFFFCYILMIAHQQSFCTPACNSEDFVAGKLTMVEYANTTSLTKQELKKQQKEERLLHRVENLMLRFEKAIHSKMQKKSISGISDPVDRWLWIWGISWGVGILITLFAGGAVAATGIGILWLLAFSIGAVSLILWLIKKFG